MAGYRATQSIQIWKQHRCVGCGALYRYLFKRTVTGRGATAEVAQAGARATLEKTMKTSVDQQPCPHCGAYQPDMAVQRRLGSYKGLSVVIWLTVLAALILAGTHAVNIPILALVAGVIVALAAAGQGWAAWRDENADPERNRRRAEAAVAKGTVRLDTPGATNQPLPEARWRRPGPVLPALLAAGVLLVPLAEFARYAAHWPLNPTFYPPVVGPGDETTFYMPVSITSIKGYWRGKPSIHFIGTDDLGLPEDEIAATTNQNTWGSTISFKSSENSEHSSPWVRFTFPGGSSLTGKVAGLHFELHTEYPHFISSGTFQTMKEDFKADANLTPAPAGAGRLYTTAWYGGASLGCLLLAAATWMLCRHARSQDRGTLAGFLKV